MPEGIFLISSGIYLLKAKLLNYWIFIMAQNVTDPKALAGYTSILNDALPVEDLPGNIVEACAIVAQDANGFLVQASSSTDAFLGVSIREGIPASEIDARFSSYGYYDDYCTFDIYGIAIVKVEPTQVILATDKITSSANGYAQAGVPGTDNLIGVPIDTSDGSGTVAVPHYIRVILDRTYVA